MQESLLFSMSDVVSTSLEVKRSVFLDHYDTKGPTRTILKLFVKRDELQFKTIARILKNRMARQTLVNSLQETVAQGILNKRGEGRSTYYSLNFKAPEQETLKKWSAFTQDRLTFSPNDLKLSKT